MSAPLVFRQISKSFRRPGERQASPILQEFSLSVSPGELVAVVGASGVGKSTLLHLAAGLERPDRGMVQVGDAERAPRLGMVFQQPRLFNWLTAGRNIEIAAEAVGIDSTISREMLAAVGLAEYESAYPLALSGGQQQRVALARAFAVEPDIVLLDEPFSALDELTARKLRGLLVRLWRKQKPSGLLVTHNTIEASQLADRIVVLSGRPARIERIVEIGDARQHEAEHPAVFERHREIISVLEKLAA